MDYHFKKIPQVDGVVNRDLPLSRFKVKLSLNPRPTANRKRCRKSDGRTSRYTASRRSAIKKDKTGNQKRDCTSVGPVLLFESPIPDPTRPIQVEHCEKQEKEKWRKVVVHEKDAGYPGVRQKGNKKPHNQDSLQKIV